MTDRTVMPLQAAKEGNDNRIFQTVGTDGPILGWKLHAVLFSMSKALVPFPIRP
jgi:hypothetical protein